VNDEDEDVNQTAAWVTVAAIVSLMVGFAAGAYLSKVLDIPRETRIVVPKPTKCVYGASRLVSSNMLCYTYDKPKQGWIDCQWRETK